MSVKSILDMKHFLITDIGTGKIVFGQGKLKELGNDDSAKLLVFAHQSHSHRFSFGQN